MKRFTIANNIITDTWTEYTYGINDYNDICGLLNHLQENIDLHSTEKTSIEQDNQRLRKILRIIQSETEKELLND